jgi:uncharacterized protein (DUF488 family)
MNETKKATAIYTIGYEGASVDAFMAALRKAGVALVLDIRAAPVSGRKDFSKTPLAQHLAEGRDRIPPFAWAWYAETRPGGGALRRS